MNKKIISEILSLSLTITSLSEIIYQNNNIAEAKERGKFSFLRGLFKILVRNYIRLHGNKIVDAVDYIESNSIAGATITFQKVVIP